MRLTQPRQEVIDMLAERDGYHCMFPGCEEELTETGKHMVTIDHIFPQVLAKADGWTQDQINDPSNLQLMGKNCNARKGHLLPDSDGNYPTKLRDPKIPKALRPALCETCFSGRILLPGEECDDCGSGPQPAMAPAALQRKPKECDHSTYHCWMCFLDFVPRKEAINRIIGGP